MCIKIMDVIEIKDINNIGEKVNEYWWSNCFHGKDYGRCQEWRKSEQKEEDGLCQFFRTI